jgi:hypothetical protein
MFPKFQCRIFCTGKLRIERKIRIVLMRRRMNEDKKGKEEGRKSNENRKE